jgi:hypothetical protein
MTEGIVGDYGIRASFAAGCSKQLIEVLHIGSLDRS